LLSDFFVAFGHEKFGLGSGFRIRIIKRTKSGFRNTALIVRYGRVVLGGRGEVAGDGHGQSPATDVLMCYDRVVLGGRGEVAGDGHGQSPATDVLMCYDRVVLGGRGEVAGD
jgi:hypothetical protein